MSTRRKAPEDAAPKAVPDSSRGARKGTASASPRHPCGEARLGSRSDRATEATSLQSSTERAAAEIDALVSTPPATRPPETVSPADAPFLSGGGPRSRRDDLLREVRTAFVSRLVRHAQIGTPPAKVESPHGRSTGFVGAAPQGGAPHCPVDTGWLPLHANAASELSATPRRCGPGTRLQKAHENLALRGNASRLSSVSAPARSETAP